MPTTSHVSPGHASLAAAPTEFLFERHAEGDPGGLQVLFERYQDHVLRTVRRRMPRHLARREDALDIAQQAMLTALAKLDLYQLRPGARFVSWLTTLALHQVEDVARRHRAAKRDARGDVPLAEPAALPSPTSCGPLTRLCHREAVEELEGAVEHLPVRQRRAIVLRDLRGLSWGEVAEELGVTVNAAYQLRARGHRAIQERLGKAG